MEKFYISRTEDSKDLPLPKYMTGGAAGMDLYAAVKRDTVIAVGEIVLIPTGIKIALPAGYEAQIRPRSGLALTYGISLANSPGTIDSDYRGEINIILINHGKQDFVVKRGERMAQIVISVTPQITWEETETLPESNRADGGFGHTGNK